MKTVWVLFEYIEFDGSSELVEICTSKEIAESAKKRMEYSHRGRIEEVTILCK